MGINHERFHHFYQVSPLWHPRDQKILVALGLEIEICFYAFDRLYEYCSTETCPDVKRWTSNPESFPLILTNARTFVDHATRIPKICSRFYKDSIIQNRCNSLNDSNRDLRNLRNALHHADERLDSLEAVDQTSPVFGDFSWVNFTVSQALEMYFIRFGSMISEEEASPPLEVGSRFFPPIDRITYRAHNISADLSASVRNLLGFVEFLHDEFSRRFDGQVAENDKITSENLAEFLPTALSGKMRVTGFTANQST